MHAPSSSTSRAGAPRRASATPTGSAGSRPSAMYECYWRGHWDEAFSARRRGRRPGRGGLPTAVSSMDARLLRSRIRLARDQAPAALEDSSRALELGRRAGYPDMIVPALALHARMLEATGGYEEARTPRGGTPLLLARALPDLVLGRGSRLRPARARALRAAACGRQTRSDVESVARGRTRRGTG